MPQAEFRKLVQFASVRAANIGVQLAFVEFVAASSGISPGVDTKLIVVDAQAAVEAAHKVHPGLASMLVLV